MTETQGGGGGQVGPPELPQASFSLARARADEDVQDGVLGVRSVEALRPPTIRRDERRGHWQYHAVYNIVCTVMYGGRFFNLFEDQRRRRSASALNAR